MFVYEQISMKTEQTHTLTFIAPLLISLFALACNDDGTTPQTPERVKLTLIDVSVRQAFLHVSVAGPAHNETLALQRNGTTAMTFPAVADTNITDTALTQTTTYQYTARLANGVTLTGTSNAITAQTLAPTSHNFTWQTFLLGDGNNSMLDDVAMIRDTLIYAAGEMYLQDSSGGLNSTPYNLAKWDGSSWQLLRIQFLVFCGQPTTFPSSIRAVFAFSGYDVWITSGSQLVRWSGNTQTQPTCIPVSVNRLWASGVSSVYAVGYGGEVARYDGVAWRTSETGTTTPILDA